MKTLQKMTSKTSEEETLPENRAVVSLQLLQAVELAQVPDLGNQVRQVLRGAIGAQRPKLLKRTAYEWRHRQSNL